MNEQRKTVIIGGVAGGASCAARLRRLDADREIVILERGAYISYANCGLPYHVGGVIKNRGALLLMTPERMWERFRIDVRVNNEVTAIDREAKTITVKSLAEGREYMEKYDVFAEKIYFSDFGEITLFKDDITIKLGKDKDLDIKIMNLNAILSKLEGMKGTLRMENYDESTKRTSFEKEE